MYVPKTFFDLNFTSNILAQGESENLFRKFTRLILKCGSQELGLGKMIIFKLGFLTGYEYFDDLFTKQVIISSDSAVLI